MLGKHAHESHLSTPMTVNSSDVEAVTQDAGAGFRYLPWPPRSYSCNFCHKGFESAQALGGHMNVHRREKAKLTHSLMNSNSSGRHMSLPYKLSHSNDQTSINRIRTLVHNPNPKFFVHPSSFGKKEIDGTPSIPRESKHSKSTPVIIFSILIANRDEANKKRTTIHRVVQDEGNNVIQSSSSMKLKPFFGSKEDYLSCKKWQRRTQEHVQSSDDLLMETSSITRADFDYQLQIAGFSKKAALVVVEEDCLDLELRLGHLPQL